MVQPTYNFTANKIYTLYIYGMINLVYTHPMLEVVMMRLIFSKVVRSSMFEIDFNSFCFSNEEWNLDTKL